MSNAMDEFAHLNDLTAVQLFERRSNLIGQAPDGNFKLLTDDNLRELVAIARILRKKVSPAAAAKNAAARKPMVPSLDSL
jgi:hypothetical protein